MDAQCDLLSVTGLQDRGNRCHFRPSLLAASLHTVPGSSRWARRIAAIIYFVDETAVRSVAQRKTAFSKTGLTLEVQDSADRFSLNMMSAVSAWGDMTFSCFEVRMNGLRFVEFLTKLQADAGRPIIVIGDNASYHIGGAVQWFVSVCGDIVVESLLFYSREINPD